MEFAKSHNRILVEGLLTNYSQFFLGNESTGILNLQNKEFYFK